MPFSLIINLQGKFQPLYTHLRDWVMDQNHYNQEDQKRISILVTKEIHKRIKLLALNADQSMKDYITSLILNKTNKQVYLE